jgi:DNA polymerase-3 subunit alpha
MDALATKIKKLQVISLTCFHDFVRIGRMEEIVPLFKSHCSLGRSILTLDKPKDEKNPEVSDSVFDIASEEGLKEVFLVEDNMTGFLQAYTNSQALGLKLIFGLRLTFCPDCLEKSEEGRKNSYKNVIFARNHQGYKQLIKIYTYAAQEGFYYEPRIDSNKFKEYYTEDLIVGVPFYDSFLYFNKYTDSRCVPDFSFCKPIFFLEDNDVLVDQDLSNSVLKFCDNKYEIIKSKTIYYKSKEDFGAYLTHRCISKRTSLEKPNFDGMCSNEFSYESYKEKING